MSLMEHLPYPNLKGAVDLMPQKHLHATEGVFDSERYYPNGLPRHDIHVVRRISHKDAHETINGTFYEEQVHFSDGAVRVATRAISKRKEKVDVTVSATDALCTGPSGYNRDVMNGLLVNGYDIEWLHHMGPELDPPKNLAEALRCARFLIRKSVGRSAHQHHAFLDDIGLDTVALIGDSRGGMTGEAIIALSPFFKRSIAFSHFKAQCFEHRPRGKEWLDIAASPKELVRSFGRVALELAQEDRRNDFRKVRAYGGTIDPDAMNILHEIAWMPVLMSGETGRYAERVPDDSIGVRELLLQDSWSQVDCWQQTHAHRPNIRFVLRNGNHLDLARQAYVRYRNDMFARLGTELKGKSNDMSQVDLDYVINGEAHHSNAA